MPNIKPVSDLRNYTEVLKEVSIDNPVYLTRNGRGEYAIVKIEELDRLKAVQKLFGALEKGEASAREEGWITADQVEAELGL
ncbi:type II toxin-antitoxin system prevent-host-death family antitoxin [Konateibacter massiliensis]|uniref:type II toxin-antitoxin system prevent-host-death family antitoxin n=1 Tax=Konateibacter massiliensis TaxID=2002841 RepID=UPI000C160DE9|nr:type II toxin-antitoxin system prevent-host-death family antitoxin [Konateibacter massiliensis]